MQYLHHNTQLGVHGNLKSTNCVIDSRWTCKITDIGLFKFKEGQDVDVEVGIDHHYNSKYNVAFYTYNHSQNVWPLSTNDA